MPSSLRGRLVLIGLAIAVIAITVTAFAVQRVTISNARGSLDRDLDTELAIRDSLAFFAAEEGSWNGVAAEVADLAQIFDQRIAIATLDGAIIADSAPSEDSDDRPKLPEAATVVDPDVMLFPIDATPEDLALLESESEAAAICLDTLGVPALEVIADGGLVISEPGPDLTGSEVEAFDACMIEILGEFGMLGEARVTPLTSRESELPPLQLFVGVGRSDAGLLDMQLTGWFWVAVLSIMAAAAAATIVMANRITNPLAARRMSVGDLDSRVDVSGSAELSHLGLAFNDMAESLEAEDQARRTLTSDVAHELRTPLANLRGYLTGIQDDVVEADAETIDLLHAEVAHLQGVVDDLQQLSLAEAGHLNLHLVETDLGDLVERTVHANGPYAASNGVELGAETQPGTMSDVDPDRLRQVLTNLSSNAIEHTEEGGRVSVRLTNTSGARIEVSDTGCGISGDHLPHLFDRFYRVDASRNRTTGGSGLGLTIARELVSAHGGTIEVESNVGEGTTFTVVLPVRSVGV